MEKLFSKFGFEPTFFPKIKIPDIFYERVNDYSYWEEVYNAYYNTLSNSVVTEIGSKFKWYRDDGNLETPTVNCYTNYKEFKKDYKHLLNVLKKHKLYPSSSLCLQSEGGCHINFDLKQIREERGAEFVGVFIKNYRNYVLSNPSIVWMFLSPYDNQSSALIYREIQPSFHKGDFFTVRGYSSENEEKVADGVGVRDSAHTKDARVNCRGSVAETQVSSTVDIRIIDQDPYIPKVIVSDGDFSRVEYMELRSYMMPRNDREFDVHFEFANALMNYVYKQTNKGLGCEFVNKPIKEYTFDRARKEFMIVCADIDFNYDKVVGVGKLQLLKKRFTFGKDYLV